MEADLIVYVNGQRDGVLSRTPGNDLNLIVGHLFCNGMINSSEDVANISFSYQNPAHVDVFLDTGKGRSRLFPSRPPVRLSPLQLFELKATFERRQNLFKNTGSTHAAALFSLNGELLVFGEDVGRHNAFDKAIGRALLEGILEQTAIAMISSRIAVELTAKATIANIPVLCGFSAATSSGVNFAEQHDITLVGRLKEDSFDVYTNAWRMQE
ncbi:sulfurtransferase FdhD [Pseudodesulfovibrio sediminis]|uniref:Sulfurtransferase FdhD n=1 Tax=Pseudodesulfovibrio sediminis TaxID=2810563 RepID=A0ABN6EPI7_9BACT|nr:sulfurtransferase FdhD [Pseudodesulfovibrio sediminis]